MNELQRILSLPKEKRSSADLEYIEKHLSELTATQAKQLEDEKEVINPLLKNIGKKIHAQFTSVIEQLEDGMLRAIVNSGKEDRHGEILDMDGLDTKEYMRNPILANAHDYSKPSVGRAFNLRKKDGALIADFKFATDIPEYPEPRILDGLYRKGWQFAFSIGFIPKEIDKNVYTKSTMIEFSPVLIPADGNALLLAKQMGYKVGDDVTPIVEKLGLDKEIMETYNKPTMNIKELLAKLKKDGKDAMTGVELKYIEDHKSELTGAEVKELAEALKDVVAPEDKKDETAVALKALKDALDVQAKELAAIKETIVTPKDISGQHASQLVGETSKMFGTTRVSKNLLDDKGEPSKEVKFLHYVRGLQTKDFTDYRNVVGKAAMNTSGNVVLPPAEFILEIERLEEQVGVAERFATVRRSTTGLGLKYVLGDDDLEIYDTAENGVKTSTKLTYKQLLLAWRKFAGILPVTDELSEDAAVDLWNDATTRFARAFAKKGDQLVFTNTLSTGNQKKGILYETGVDIVTASGITVSSITWQNLSDMQFGVPSASAANGRYFLNRDVLGVIAKIKDDENRPIFREGVAGGLPSTICGKPYTEVEVMPKLTEEEAGLPVIAFGDLKYATLGMRTDLNIKIFDTGNVGDPDQEPGYQESDDINLLTQDVQAMRAVKRMNAVVRFPAAFSRLELAENS